MLLKADGKQIKTIKKLKQCVCKGAITVEFVEVPIANQVIQEDEEYSDIQEEVQLTDDLV